MEDAKLTWRRFVDDRDPSAVRRRFLTTTLVILGVVTLTVGQGHFLRGERASGIVVSLVAAATFILGVVVLKVPSTQRLASWIVCLGFGVIIVGRIGWGVVQSLEDGGLPGRLPQGAAFFPINILLTFVLLRRREANAVAAGLVMAVAATLGAYFVLTSNPAVTATQLYLVDSFVIAPAATVLLAALYSELKELFENSASAQRSAEVAAHTDSLTGLLNRRGFELQFESAEGPWCLAVLDIDHFKRVNDDGGHALGDAVLKEVTSIVRRGLRGTDLVGRWGGEEFVVRLSHCEGIEQGLRAAEKLRKLIASETRVTVSIGVACAGLAEGLSSVFLRADEAVYGAKEAGRNRVAAWDTSESRVETCPSIPDPQTVDLPMYQTAKS